MIGAGKPRPRGTTPRIPRAASRVVVRNYSWDHVTLYLARDGVKAVRLGELEAFSDRTFPIPSWALTELNDVHLVARQLAGRSFRSESFIFPTGATAVWTIESQPAMSHVMLRQ